MPGRVVLWDFDGTLAVRAGMWRGCLIETLDAHSQGHGVDVDALKPLLKGRFPWHRADVAHPEFSSSPDAWWSPIEQMMAAAYEGVGIAPLVARDLASRARKRFVDHTVGWQLFDDTVPVLAQLSQRGWRHTIISNHVPELPALVDGLGIGGHFDHVFTSAATGFEKPHPDAFQLALTACGDPSEVWMVGDNPVADAAGAEAAGIPAIHVRAAATGNHRYAADLYAAAEIIAGGYPPPTVRRTSLR